MAMPRLVPGAVATPVEPGLLRRMSQAIGSVFRGGPPAGSPSANAMVAAAEAGTVPVIDPGQAISAGDRPLPPSTTPWMGPGQPIRPDAPARDVAGRAFDYPSGYNIGIRPRRFEGPSFEQLRALAENCDVLRLCLETVKDQMATLTGSVVPAKQPGQIARPPSDARCQKIQNLLKRPDRRNTLQAWIRLLMEDMLVIDAPAIYIRRALNGEVYSLDVVDGATISPLIDSSGRVPEAPQPAYQQILKGVPAINYTSEELLYWPRNRRSNRLYGMPPVQQIILTVNTALRREISRMAYYTEGNVPEAICGVPDDWSPDQIERFQTLWDAMLADQAVRRRMYFVPGKMAFQPTRTADAMMDAFDEWLARIITYAFSLPPLPFVKQVNRDTAETAYETARAEGMQPRMLWLKEIFDHIIQTICGAQDLEWVWDDVDDLDEAERLPLDIQRIRMGLKSIDDVRAESGQEPLGIGPFIMGIGPLGIMFLDDLKRLKAQGALMGAPAAPPDAAAGAAFGGGGDGSGDPNAPMPGQPGAGVAPAPGAGGPAALLGPFGSAAPGIASSIRSLPPDLMAAVGLGAGGPDARGIDVTSAEAASSDPLTGLVAHPTVLRTLREAERTQAAKRRGTSGRR